MHKVWLEKYSFLRLYFCMVKYLNFYHSSFVKDNFHVLPTIQNLSNLNIAPENGWMDEWMVGA
jgi:hypothetical protein